MEMYDFDTLNDTTLSTEGVTPPANSTPSFGGGGYLSGNSPSGSNPYGGGSNAPSGSGGNSSGSDPTELLGQSPFGRLSEVLGDDLSSIFSGVGGDSSAGGGNPFGGGSNPFGSGTAGSSGSAPSGASSSDLPYGGNPFAGNNFSTIFGGSTAGSSGSAPSGGSPFGSGGAAGGSVPTDSSGNPLISGSNSVVGNYPNAPVGGGPSSSGNAPAEDSGYPTESNYQSQQAMGSGETTIPFSSGSGPARGGSPFGSSNSSVGAGSSPFGAGNAPMGSNTPAENSNSTGNESEWSYDFDNVSGNSPAGSSGSPTGGNTPQGGNSSGGDPTELLKESPFGPLFELPGIDSAEDIFGSSDLDSGNPFAGLNLGSSGPMGGFGGNLSGGSMGGFGGGSSPTGAGSPAGSGSPSSNGSATDSGSERFYDFNSVSGNSPDGSNGSSSEGKSPAYGDNPVGGSGDAAVGSETPSGNPFGGGQLDDPFASDSNFIAAFGRGNVSSGDSNPFASSAGGNASSTQASEVTSSSMNQYIWDLPEADSATTNSGNNPFASSAGGGASGGNPIVGTTGSDKSSSGGEPFTVGTNMTLQPTVYILGKDGSLEQLNDLSGSPEYLGSNISTFGLNSDNNASSSDENYQWSFNSSLPSEGMVLSDGVSSMTGSQSTDPLGGAAAGLPGANNALDTGFGVSSSGFDLIG